MNVFLKSGRFFLAIPMLIFPVFHFMYPAFVAGLVPPWIPWHLFWNYFTAVTIFAAGLAILFRLYAYPAAILLGIEIFLFVALIHGELLFHGTGDTWAESAVFPKLLSDRLINAFKDFGLCGAVFIFAATQTNTRNKSGRNIFLIVGRSILALSITAFGVLHFLYPQYAPGIPPMSADVSFFIPGRPFWEYGTGACLLTTGLIILLGKKSRLLITWLGIMMLVFDLLVWGPRFVTHPGDLGGNWLKDLGIIGGVLLLADPLLPSQYVSFLF